MFPPNPFCIQLSIDNAIVLSFSVLIKRSLLLIWHKLGWKLPDTFLFCFMTTYRLLNAVSLGDIDWTY